MRLSQLPDHQAGMFDMWLWIAVAAAFLAIAIYSLVLLERIDDRLRALLRLLSLLQDRAEIEEIEPGKIGAAITLAVDFLAAAECGQIPSLRKDNWVPSISDRERAEKTFLERSEDDRHLGAYHGP
jgi:hypothetical protein